MFESVKPLLPAVLGVYVVSCALVWAPVLPFLIALLALGALVRYSIPPVSPESAAAVLTPDKPQMIAHKCGAGEGPENTISGIRQAKKNGADGIEFDVGYTSDGVAVLMHDDMVDRTTDGVGILKTMAWDNVQKLNASIKGPFLHDYPEEKVPSLEEAVQTCLQLGLKIYFDVKGNAAQSAETIPALYQKYPELYKMGIVCSFYPQLIYKLRQVDPKIVTALTWRPRFLSHKGVFEEPYDGPKYKHPIRLRKADPKIITALSWRPLIFTHVVTLDVLHNFPSYKLVFGHLLNLILDWSHFTWLWKLCGNSAFLVSKEACNNYLVRKFAERGVQVVVWTVNDDVEKSYFSKALKCSVITDHVKSSVPSKSS